MAKNSKKSKDAATIAPSPTLSASTAPSDAGFDVSGKTSSAKPTVAKTTRKPRSAAARKTPAAAKPRKSPIKKKPAPAQVAVSDDEIRLRAYFIAERRVREGIEGDSSNDWLEARRQLMEEAAGRA